MNGCFFDYIFFLEKQHISFKIFAMKRSFIIFIWLFSAPIANSQKTMGYFIGGTYIFYDKMESGISVGLTHSRSYKDNNKWQNVLGIGYFPGEYTYITQPQNTQKLFKREVTANNFDFRIGKEYGLLLINKRTKKFFTGPSLSLMVLVFYEQGTNTDLQTNEQDLHFTDFNLEFGISPGWFMEYEYTLYQNSFFLRYECAYLYNPVQALAPYGGFPGSWIMRMSAGYRINRF